MNEAINAYNSITVSPECRELERARAYARHNEASALGHARREGEKEGIVKGIAKGMEQERKKWQGMAEKWQGVVADKDAEIERLRAELDRK
jgi:flagellar biosynthesis/type III secretory pathway protein FliH